MEYYVRKHPLNILRCTLLAKCAILEFQISVNVFTKVDLLQYYFGGGEPSIISQQVAYLQIPEVNTFEFV